MKPITIRPNDALYDAVKKLADTEKRSINNQCLSIIETHIERTKDMDRLLSQQERDDKFNAACRCYDHNHNEGDK